MIRRVLDVLDQVGVLKEILKLVLEVEALALSESNTVRARGLC